MTSHFTGTNIAMTFSADKLERYGYPTVKKLKIQLLVLTESTNVTDRRTHTRNTHTHRHRVTA